MPPDPLSCKSIVEINTGDNGLMLPFIRSYDEFSQGKDAFLGGMVVFFDQLHNLLHHPGLAILRSFPFIWKRIFKPNTVDASHRTSCRLQTVPLLFPHGFLLTLG